MTEEQAVDIFKGSGALIEGGHFRLASERHATIFVAKQLVSMWPRRLLLFAQEIAARHARLGIQTVVVPASGAVALGSAVAHELGVLTGQTVRSVFVERPWVAGSPLTLKRSFGAPFSGRPGGKRVHELYSTLGGMRELGELRTAQGGRKSSGYSFSGAMNEHGTNPAIVRRFFASSPTDNGAAVLCEANEMIVYGFWLAHRLGANVPLIYAEREVQRGAPLALRDHDLPYVAGTNVLVVEDVVTTGGSLTAVRDLTTSVGGRVLTECALWNSGDYRRDGFTALVNKRIKDYAPGKGTCPGCDADIPISKKFGRGPA